MKHVVSKHQVAHLWAHQAQDSARNGCGNFYFHGDTIYSYGSHFPIARIDKDTVLFTTGRYSNTTSKHIGTAHAAIQPKQTIVYCANVKANRRDSHKENLNALRTEIDNLIPVFLRARNRGEWIKRDIDSKVKNYNTYRDLYYRTLKPLKIDFSDKSMAAKLAEIKRLSAMKALETRKIKLEQKETECWIRDNLDLIIKSWHEFNPDATAGHNIPRNTFNRIKDELYPGAMLRTKNGTVYTSQGAEFPVEHARLAWKIVKHCKDTGTEFTPNGHTIHLGNFQIDKIDSQGNVTAGCHNVTFAECETLAKQLNF